MDKPKPFSMIREFHLADWFTLANAFCGVGALFAVMSFLQTGDIRHVYFACWLIPAALVFDVLARIDRGEAVEPSSVYFRSLVRFETAAPKHDWLNHVVAVGIGHRRADGPVYNVFEVL